MKNHGTFLKTGKFITKLSTVWFYIYIYIYIPLKISFHQIPTWEFRISKEGKESLLVILISVPPPPCVPTLPPPLPVYAI